MAGSMDERVVSMEFDNRNFEKNVKHSMKTIEDLKESLDFDESGKSLDEIDKKFSRFGKNNVFKDVNESCTSLRKGMAILGDSTAGLVEKFMEMTRVTAIIHAAEAAVRGLERSIKQFTIAPINEGFGKYTTKIGAIKTISNATKLGAEQVNEELERLNWFTDETSASFGNMVENIGKFTSVGRGLDESITAMQGIATWGYQSGAGVQEINRAMYNLSQALGTGSVKLMDWKSIENAGMATEEFKKQAIAAAEAAGTLKRKGDKLFAGNQEVTTANFNATLAKGWFSSDVLMSVLDTYGGFAKELRDYMEKNPDIETAKDAMYEMDDKRINQRAKVFQDNLEIFGDKAGITAEQVQEKMDEIAGIEKLKEREKAVEDFAKTFGVEMSEVRRINEIANVKEKEKEIDKWAKALGVSSQDARKILEALAETEETLGEKAFKSSQQSKSLSDAIEATKDAVSTGWMNTFQKIFGGLEESVELWSDVTDILWDLFASGANWRNNAFTHWAEEFAGRDDLWGEDGIMHSIMDTIIELKQLLGSSFKNVFFKDLSKVLGVDSGEDGDEKNGEYTHSQLAFIREGNYFGEKIKNVTTAVKNFGLSIRNFVTNNMEKFQQIFESAATVVKFFTGLIGGVFRTIGDFITKTGIFQDILNIITNVANKVRGLFERIESSGFVTKVLEKIGNTFIWFYNTIKKWIGQISEFFEETGIGQAIRGFFKKIEEFFLGGEGDVDATGKRTESGFFRAFGWIGSIKEWIGNINLKDALYAVKNFVDNFGTLCGAFTAGLAGEEVNSDELVANGLPKELKGVADAFFTVGSKLSGIVNFFKNVWEGFVGWLETSGVLPTLRSWWDGIKTFFGNIGLVWEAFTTGKVADPSKLNKKQKNLVNGVINFAKKLQKAWQKVKDWFVGVWDWIKDIWGKFVGWLENSGILPKIREIWQSIKDFFGSIGTVWDVLVGGANIDPSDLTDTELGIIEAVSGFFNGIREAWSSALGWLESSGILPTIREWWQKIKEFFEEVWNSIGEGSIFQKVGDFFENLWSKFIGLFGGGESGEGGTVDVGGMLPKVEAKGASGGGIFSGIIKAFTNEEGNFDLLKGLSEGFVGLIKSIGTIDWTSISANVFGVMVKIINGLDDACKKLRIDNIIAVIQKIVGAFTGLMIARSISDVFSTIRTIVKKGKDKGILEKFTDLLSAFGSALLQIGITVALIAGSMWLISKIDPNRFNTVLNVMIGIGAFILGFVVVAYILTRTMGKDGNKLAKTFAAIGSMFLEIGIAVALIVASVWFLSLMLGKNGEIGDKLRNAMLIVAGIMLVMVGMVALISLLTKKIGTVNIAIGIATFLGISILLAVCVAAILLLQNVNPGKAFTVIGEITVLLILITGMLVVLAKTVKKFNPKMLVGMITMAVMIGLIVAAFFLLKDAEPGSLIEIAGSIVLILGGIVGAIMLLQHVSPAGAGKAALAIGAFILAVSAALAVGGLIISASARALVNTLVSIMSSMNAAGISASTIDRSAILDAIALLEDIVVAFALTKACDTTNALAVASDTWTFLNRMKLASQSAEQVNVEKFKAIFGEDGTGGILTIICTALSNVSETGETALAMSSNLKTFGENLQAFGESAAKFSSKDTGYSSGIKELFGSDGKGGLFNAIKTGISGVTDTGFAARVLLWNLVDMGNHIELLATSGSKLGGDAETNIGNVKSRLEDLNAIVSLARKLNAGGEGGKSVDLNTFALGVTNIGSALQIYNSAVATLEEEVSKGTNGEDVTDIKPISTEKIRQALELIVQALPNAMPDPSQISNVEKWASMAGEDEGRSSAFALGLVAMSNALGAFSKSAADFDSENSEKAIGALSQLAGIYTATNNGNPGTYDDTISGIAGWSGYVGKDNNAFSSAIIGMGNALASFSTSAESYNPFKGLLAIGALGMLARIYKTTGMDNPSQYTSMIDGVKKWDLGGGENDKGSFTNAIIGMGNAMKSFGDSVSGIKSDAVTSATTALDTLAEIWLKLKDNSSMIEYFSGGDAELDAVVERLNKGSITELFTDFGEGIGKIGDAVASFGQAVSGDDKKYDPTKVQDAVSVVKAMGDMQIALTQANINGDWWTRLWFGENNDLTVLGQNMSTLGGYLTTFSTNLAGFDVPTGEGTKWESAEKILNSFLSISTTLNGLYDIIDTYDEYGIRRGTIVSQKLTLMDFGEGINEVISAFGNDFFTKFASANSNIDPDKFNAFFTAVKTLAEAMAILHEKTNSDDLAYLRVLLDDVSKWSMEDNKFTGDFNGKGALMAAEFIRGLVNGIANATEDNVEGVMPLSASLGILLAELDTYSADFFEKGTNAGKEYARGFNDGLNDIDSGKLVPFGADSFARPVVSMDADGNVAENKNSLLYSFAYLTAAFEEMDGLATRLDTIQRNFDNPIVVNDNHKDIVEAIGRSNDKLTSIDREVSLLKTRVDSLKVYMDTNRLVGAIAPAMNRELGKMANVSP